MIVTRTMQKSSLQIAIYEKLQQLKLHFSISNLFSIENDKKIN